MFTHQSRLGSISSADVPSVKFQSDRETLDLCLVFSRLRETWQLTSYYLMNRGRRYYGTNNLKIHRNRERSQRLNIIKRLRERETRFDRAARFDRGRRYHGINEPPKP